MGISSIRTTVRKMVNAKMRFGDYRSNYDGLEKKYSEPEFRSTNSGTTRTFHDKNNREVAVIKVETSPKNNSFHKISLYDNLTQRTYVADEVSSETDNPIFTILVGYGYRIIDNGNGYVDENDTIEYNREEKYKKTSIKNFLNSYETPNTKEETRKKIKAAQKEIQSAEEYGLVPPLWAKNTIEIVKKAPFILQYMRLHNIYQVSELKNYISSSEEKDEFVNAINLPTNIDITNNENNFNKFFDLIEVAIEDLTNSNEHKEN